MTVYNLPIGVCTACRIDHANKGKDISCDINEICVKTKNLIDDPEEFMDLGPQENDVLYLWSKIATLSPMEQVQTQGRRGKEIINHVVYLKTMAKLEFILDNTHWDYYTITKEEAIEYIQTFHATYCNLMMRQHE